MLIMPNMTMESSNVRNNKGTIKCDKNTVTYDIGTIDTVFCSTPIHARQNKNQKIINFKVKKGKNKYNMMGWRIKRLQFLKIIFVAIKAKTLVGPC